MRISDEVRILFPFDLWTPSTKSMKLIDGLTAVTAVAALAVSALAFSDRWSQRSGDVRERERNVDNWSEVVSSGHRIGSDNPIITIVEFGDYECPSCKQFHQSLAAAMRRHPNAIQLVYRHWPLPYHANALSGAKAAICAAGQGHFEPYHYSLYEGRRPLGDWIGHAKEVGIQDLHSFENCLNDPTPIAQLHNDTVLVSKLRLPGTPSVLIDGVLLAGVPDSVKLEELIQRAKTARN